LFTNLEISSVSDFLNLPCAYFSIMAFLPSSFEQELLGVQKNLLSKLNKPITFGLGPRYLHSTGQIHKGGQSNGGFIQITQEIKTELAIPGEKYTFGQLISAQALGDAGSLTARGLPLLRIHIKNRDCDLSKILN
jgi:glucose-6-phosphate isomerase